MHCFWYRTCVLLLGIYLLVYKLFFSATLVWIGISKGDSFIRILMSCDIWWLDRPSVCSSFCFSICLFFHPSVCYSTPLTYKVQYLSLKWWYSNQTIVSSFNYVVFTLLISHVLLCGTGSEFEKLYPYLNFVAARGNCVSQTHLVSFFISVTCVFIFYSSRITPNDIILSCYTLLLIKYCYTIVTCSIV